MNFEVIATHPYRPAMTLVAGVLYEGQNYFYFANPKKTGWYLDAVRKDDTWEVQRAEESVEAIKAAKNKNHAWFLMGGSRVCMAKVIVRGKFYAPRRSLEDILEDRRLSEMDEIERRDELGY